MKTNQLKSIAAIAVIAGCLAMPFSASALVLGSLGPTRTSAAGIDVGSPGNVAPWFTWWNSLGTAICIGPNNVNCTGKGLLLPSGTWETQSYAFCNNGTQSTSGLLFNTVFTVTTCAGWPFVVSTQGGYGLDAAPFGSTP
jgi:hypothetical protein